MGTGRCRAAVSTTYCCIGPNVGTCCVRRVAPHDDVPVLRAVHEANHLILEPQHGGAIARVIQRVDKHRVEHGHHILTAQRERSTASTVAVGDVPRAVAAVVLTVTVPARTATPATGSAVTVVIVTPVVPATVTTTVAATPITVTTLVAIVPAIPATAVTPTVIVAAHIVAAVASCIGVVRARRHDW